MSCLLPDSPNLEKFWDNVLNSHVSIIDVPEDRWLPQDFYDPNGEPGSVVENKTYSKIGGFVRGFEFDWRRWKIPPGSLPQIDVTQLWAVTVSAAALEHAGYGEGGKELNRAATGVVFANAVGGENRDTATLHVHVDQAIRLAQEGGMTDADTFRAKWTEKLPKIDEDTMPGELANVIAGRVANMLDLQGPNYTTDAACASSMAAMVDSCRQLQSRQVDTIICGASDRSMNPSTYAKFSAIGALSPSHSTPFDARANGFVMGEGAGAFILKRLNDAIVDGDEVYGVIRGVGASSDGRGKGIAAPSQRGQRQAVKRAYAQAGFDSTAVELVEAHGTSTRVGDATELGTLSEVFSTVSAGENVAVGSVKSQIGHLKAAAGIAGMLKTTLALHHRTIPPSAGFSTPNETVDWNKNPFYVPTEASEWPIPASGAPRRAGVSAFGFGGTNFHVALEAFDPEYHASLADLWSASYAAAMAKLSDGSESLSKYEVVSSDIGGAASGKLNSESILDANANPSMTHEELKAVEGGVLLLNAGDVSDLKAKLQQLGEVLANSGATFDDDPRGRRLSVELPRASKGYVTEGVRLALVATSWSEFNKRVGLALKAMDDQEKWGFLAAQGVLLSADPALPSEAKVAHLYPGQGSQYVGMTLDLSKRWSAVGHVWAQADKTMVEVLDGETLSSFVLRENLSNEEKIEAEHKLKQTEYTQPAMLTADLAIEGVLNSHGFRPDMVAGHSLGEYAALMSSGILGMDGALRAAAARGTEMGQVEIDDTGLMASITAPYERIAEIIEGIDGYVIAANKNSPKMTVIAGETKPVEEAISIFESEGFPSAVLATSHAFHSRIVAPANEPLKRFLNSLEINWPQIPLTSNVDGGWYPDTSTGGSAKDAILTKLAPQMASAVEWTKQIETMYAGGARLFVEVGPKRALTVFSSQILEEKPHLAVMSNHPKQGGIASILQAMGMLALAGRMPQWPAAESPQLTEAFRAGPIEAHDTANVISSSEYEDLRIRSRPLPSASNSTPTSALPSQGPTATEESAAQISMTTARISVAENPQRTKERWVGSQLSSICGYPAKFCEGQVDLRTGLGMSATQVETALSQISGQVATDAEFDRSSITTADDLTRWVLEAPTGWNPAAQSMVYPTPSSTNIATSVASTNAIDATAARRSNPYVVTGISLGLPGEGMVFDDDNFEKLVRGETCITQVSDEKKQRILDKNIVRLIKGSEGQARMESATEFSDIPQLAGQMGEFDITAEFGIDAKIVRAWDTSTQLAVASGLLALRDAAIPLTPEEKVGKGGLRLITNWQIPQTYRESTGIVFASCFPGLAKMAEKVKNNGDDGEGRFDRSFLFQVLNMGHSQFAQMTGIRGPNTTVNLACASTAAAFSVAEDWLDTGRVERVVIISADNVTDDDLWEWIGGGFAASGAASTSDDVENAALPFDARRNGMILGMGAASFVVERRLGAAERGVQPYAELLGATLANSSFHGTRLDIEHVSASVNGFVSKMESKWGLQRDIIAPHTFFMSHETYTPARGGSAQAEVKALRDTFGESTDKLVVTNTKGFTGHPMGVGIEDASLIYALATGRAPPISNHKVDDPELGNLNLSEGGDYAGMEYGLRFAAGFGSQLSVTLWKRSEISGERIDGERLMAWNRRLAGQDNLELRILDNKLVAYVGGDDNLHGGVKGEAYSATSDLPKPQAAPATTASAPIVDSPAPVSAPSPSSESPAITVEPSTVAAMPIGDTSEVEGVVIEVVVTHTGYPADFIELDQDLEGELGIDTVKQAEIMGDIREKFSLPVDDDFVLSDHPTLNHMIAYIMAMQGGEESTSTSIAQPSVTVTTSTETVAETPELDSTVIATLTPAETLAEAPAPSSNGDIVEIVLDVVVKHTGYPKDFLELDQDLEGELGIDTVKQAEIMGDIREKFTLPVDDDFVLSDHPTLNHMIAYIEAMQGESMVQTPSAIPALETEVIVAEPAVDVSESVPEMTAIINEGADLSMTEPQSGLHRWQVEVEATSGISEAIDLSGKLVVVTEDGWGIAEQVCTELERHGVSALRLSLELLHKKFTEEKEGTRRILRADPASAEQLEDAAATILKSGDFGGLIHLAPTHLAGNEWLPNSADSAGAVVMQGLFGLLKNFDSDISEAGKNCVLASLSALDGRHGNKGSRFNSLAAGSSGIVKAYSHERPEIRCRAWDVHPEMLLDEAGMAKILVDDLLNIGGEVEVGLEADGSRWGLVLFDEVLESEAAKLANDEVWIVSGGGSGVTASCIIGLCQASPKSKATFALLGRTELLEEPAAWLDWSEEQLNERKLALREELVGESEDGKVSIVAWNKAWAPYLRSRDIHATIAAITVTGNKAEYHACDVCDTSALAELGRQIGKSHGTITGIVHGAGIEESKLVADKEWPSFANVVRVKIDGWTALSAAAKASGSEDLRHACAFTSVAGRFGNGGQTDYSAANNILDAEMARLAATGKTKAVAIAWTGWRDVGMATRGSIEAIFAAAGIETLSVEEGVGIFVDEMLCGGKRRVVACGSLGMMDKYDSFRAPPLRLPAQTTATLENPSRFPFIDRLLAFSEDEFLTGESTLSVEEMPFLTDHAIDGVPYHPGVMAMEMFAQHALLLCPNHALAGFENVEFGLPIKLMKGEMKVRTKVEIDRQEGDLTWVKAVLESDLVNSKGQVLGQPRIHHQAKVRLVTKADDLTGHFVSELASSPRLGVPVAGELVLPASFIYERYFHGPRFQSHGGVIRGVGDIQALGCDGIALMRHQLPASDQWAAESAGEVVMLESLPMLVEAGFQNAGLVAMEADDISSLPIGIGWTSVLRVPNQDERLRLRSILTGRADGGITTHDVTIYGDDDAPVLSMKDLRLKSMGPVPEEQQFTLTREG